LAGSRDLAKAVLENVGENKAAGAFLCNHGLLTVGKDMAKAVERTMMVEQTLDMLFTIVMLGKEPAELNEKAVKLLTQFGSVI